jgi:hypothetical protein
VSDPDLVYQHMGFAYDARIMVGYSLYAAPRKVMKLDTRNIKQVSIKQCSRSCMYFAKSLFTMKVYNFN